MLVGTSHKSHFGRDYWVKAMQGDKESLDYIWEHNKWDVKDLETLYNKVSDFSMRTDRSI
jgi:uncharacterized protein YprB with RNaseH-like and TPR domain